MQSHRFSVPMMVLVSLAVAGASGAQPVSYDIRVVDPGPVATAIEVEFTLTNETNGEISVLKWDTPLEGLRSKMFQLSRNGETVDYQGIVVKRGDPPASAYLTLAAGASQTVTVDISKVYDVSIPGDYEALFELRIHDVRQPAPLLASLPGAELLFQTRQIAQFEPRLREGFMLLRFPTSTLLFSVEPAWAILPPSVELLLEPSAAVEAIGCSEDQEKQVRQGLDEGRSMADEVVSDLDAHSAADPGEGYKTWFGDPAGRFAKAKTNFDAISLALRNEPLRLNCGGDACEDGDFAYVTPTDKNWNVHLCESFWDAPLTGTDSKGGTLVHEVSHFKAVADTDDIEYGQEPCKKLATDDPDDAIRNADSHEYFAEGQ